MKSLWITSATLAALLCAAIGCISCSSRSQETAAATGAGLPAAQQGESPAAIPAPPDVAAPPATAEATHSGLRSIVLRAGKRLRKPAIHDRVEVHLTGWKPDGTMFETTAGQGRPLSRAVKDGPPGLGEALQLMTRGEKRRVWIPAVLAYQGRGGKPDSAVVYDIELVRIHEGVPPLLPPADLKAPSPDAIQTASGLTYRMLAKGETLGQRPRESDRVEVHYTGWSSDGTVFDSSVARGEPAMLAMKDLMPGWAEGLRLMREGDRVRLWIPERLTHTSEAKQPGGTLVMDVELLEVHREGQ